MKYFVFVAIGLVLVTGCGPKGKKGGTVTGTIQYKGKPVNGALLRFLPISGEGEEVKVPVTQEGTFRSSDVPPGEYKIVVEGTKPPPEVMKMMEQMKDAEMKKKYQQTHSEAPTIEFPDKYKKAGSTDLKCTVAQGKTESLKLDLTD